jgi:hypothetical protein
MLKNVAGKTARRLGAEAYGFWYVEANSRLRTPLGAGRVSARRGGRVRRTPFSASSLEIRMLGDRQRKVPPALFVQHTPGGEIGQR